MIQFFVFVTQRDYFFSLPSGKAYEGKIPDDKEEKVEFSILFNGGNIMNKANWNIVCNAAEKPLWWNPWRDYLPFKALGIFMEELDKTIDGQKYPKHISIFNQKEVTPAQKSRGYNLFFEKNLGSRIKGVFSKNLPLGNFFSWGSDFSKIEYLQEQAGSIVGKRVSEYFFTNFENNAPLKEIQKLLRQLVSNDTRISKLFLENPCARNQYFRSIDHTFMALLTNMIRQDVFSIFGTKNPFLPAATLYKEGLLPIILDHKLMLIAKTSEDKMKVIFAEKGIFDDQKAKEQ